MFKYEIHVHSKSFTSYINILDFQFSVERNPNKHVHVSELAKITFKLPTMIENELLNFIYWCA